MTDSFWVEKSKTAITVSIPKIYDLLQCKNPNRSGSECLQKMFYTKALQCEIAKYSGNFLSRVQLN